MKLRTVQRHLRFLLNHYLNHTGQDEIHKVRLLAATNWMLKNCSVEEVITYGYNYLSNELAHKKISLYTIEVNPFPDSVYGIPYFQAVRKLNEVCQENRDIVSTFLVHGSLATFDFVRYYSDIDTWVSILREVVLDQGSLKIARERLINGNRIITEFNALQHHGLIFVTEIDLDFYSQAFMPIVVLRQARSLGGQKAVLEIHEKTFPEELLDDFMHKARMIIEAAETGVLRSHGFNGEFLKDRFENKDNALYQFKYFLDVLSMLPVLYLQLGGEYYYKREAITRFEEEGFVNADLLDASKRVRSLWKHATNSYEGEEIAETVRKNCIPDWIVEQFPKDYFAKAKGLVEEMSFALREKGVLA